METNERQSVSPEQCHTFQQSHTESIWSGPGPDFTQIDKKLKLENNISSSYRSICHFGDENIGYFSHFCT